MLPTDLLKAAFYLFVVAPAAAAIPAFTGSPPLRRIARYVLAAAWLGYGAATLACLWFAFARPSPRNDGSQVVSLFAIPLAAVGLVLFMVWRAARRHDYVQSLPPAERNFEELADIERGIEAATRSLATAERQVGRFGISSQDRARLRFEIDMLKATIRRLEEEQAKRR